MQYHTRSDKKAVELVEVQRLVTDSWQSTTVESLQGSMTIEGGKNLCDVRIVVMSALCSLDGTFYIASNRVLSAINAYNLQREV